MRIQKEFRTDFCKTAYSIWRHGLMKGYVLSETEWEDFQKWCREHCQRCLYGLYHEVGGKCRQFTPDNGLFPKIPVRR